MIVEIKRNDIMKNLAIIGHLTRGKEVIALLEMLGGINTYNLYGDKSYAYYTIDSDKEIKGGIYVFGDEKVCHFTLEEFEEKFPYKIGDKVLYYKNPVFITQIEWIEDSVSYHFYYKGRELILPVNHLQPYKEEEENFAECIEKTMEENIEEIKINIPRGYEFARIDDDNQHVVFTKKIQPQYPKTYEECCEILSIPSYYKLRYYTYEHGYNEYTTLNKLCSFQDKLNILSKLLICRDAYWKIAGEQMGLGKPWEPDWRHKGAYKYVICRLYTGIVKVDEVTDGYTRILAFPTAEMRDAFFENFKELIENCKELL